MYLNILKKDLKRKRAMNIILLVFIILASMFISSSVNNIFSVTIALDKYFDMAEVPDYLAATSNKNCPDNLLETIENADGIDELRSERIIYMTKSNFTRGGKVFIESNNTMVLQSDRDISLNYFLEDHSILESVPKGKFYLTAVVAELSKLEVGDKVTFTLEGVSRELTFAGTIMDASCGSRGMQFGRFFVNDEDFSYLLSSDEVNNTYGGSFCYIYTHDLDGVLSELKEILSSFSFSGDKPLLKFTYVFDMVMTGVILVMSLILIAISFVVLRFTITFTLSEEFREIGVMKAVGIRNLKIRGLYLVKYSALAVIGAGIGLVLSFPFGSLLTRLTVRSILIDRQNTAFINILCALFVVGIILLFCLGCTGRVSKMSPIDAVRNGQTGERFRKKSLMSLGKSKLGVTPFLALNDVVSSPKRFGNVALTFFLCLSLLLLLSNTVTTLDDKSILRTFGMADCDVTASASSKKIMGYLSEGGRENIREHFKEIESRLKENGMPGRCMVELFGNLTIRHGDRENVVNTWQGTGTTMDMYEYIEGTPPKYTNEIAITHLTADSIKAGIGDKVTIVYDDGERDYIITAIFQSMATQGTGVRLHVDEEINYVQMSGWMQMQIKFTDDPDDKEAARRIEKIKKLFPDLEDIKTAGEAANDNTRIGDTLDTIKKITAVLTIILAAMVTVLMERSFIAKEKGEIALMKAIGVKNGRIYRCHAQRFAFVGIAAIIPGEVLSMPLTKLCIDPLFKMMGLEVGVKYFTNPLETYLIFPFVILITTTLSALLTSLYTRKIKPADTAGIE